MVLARSRREGRPLYEFADEIRSLIQRPVQAELLANCERSEHNMRPQRRWPDGDGYALSLIHI